jgi:hypothetical protein
VFGQIRITRIVKAPCQRPRNTQSLIDLTQKQHTPIAAEIAAGKICGDAHLFLRDTRFDNSSHFCAASHVSGAEYLQARVRSGAGNLRQVSNKTHRLIVWREPIGSLLICLLPLVLLIDLRNTFYVDWFNHLWIIEYFGDYIRWHRSAPQNLVTAELVGIVNPIFYGEKFYAAAGLISCICGPAIAFRIVALVALLVQFWHVERAVSSCTENKSLSFGVATLLSWAIYPLTNLYNRSALTEFIAVTLLTAAVASIFVLVIRLSHGHKSHYDAVAFGFLYVAAALTHPLTALFGGLFLISIGLCAFFALRIRWLAMVGICNLVATALALSPWYYVLHRFRKSLPVGDASRLTAIFRNGGYFPNTIDNLWSRLSPVPVDFRSILKGNDVSTPYLDAQIILPMVFLACGLALFLFKSAREMDRRHKLLLILILCLSVILFFIFLAVSVNPSLSSVFGGLFDVLQFPYRLTTYVNLAALTGVFALVALISWDQVNSENIKSRFMTVLLTLCLTISFSALVAKLIHADAIRLWNPGTQASTRQLINMPRTFYGYGDFTVVDGFLVSRPAGSYMEQSIALPPDSSRHFGMIRRIVIELASPTLVVTNVQAFPWNMLIVDGVKQRRGMIYALKSGAFADWLKPVVQAVLLAKGKHVLEYIFQSDTKWQVLDGMSWGIILIWATVWLFVGFVHRRRDVV